MRYERSAHPRSRHGTALGGGAPTLLGPVRNVDTWYAVRAGTYAEVFDGLVAYLESLPSGTLVLLAVGDDAGLTGDVAPSLCTLAPGQPTQRLLNALEALGSAQIRGYCFRDSWAMLARSLGNGRGQRIEEQLGKGMLATVRTAITLP